MRAPLFVLVFALVFALFFLSACSPSTPTSAPGSDGATEPAGATVEPRTESLQNAATVGKGKERCSLFVYPWDPAAPGCQISVTHCEEKGQELQCMSLADVRRVACGAKEGICGEDVTCACPKGPARPVDDAPGTVKLRPGGKGTAWKSPGCRAEEVDELPRVGKPPVPACLMRIHECDEGQTCDEQTYTLWCGIRSDVCGRPVHCACP